MMPLETSCIPLPKRMNMMYGKISGTPLHQENFIMSRSLHDPCHNRTLRVCEDETHTPEMGTWESSETPETSEFDCKGQNTSHWGVLHIIRKISKLRC